MNQDKPNGKITGIEWQLMLEEAKRNAQYIIEYWQTDSKIMRARYQALIAEGFSEKEALEIIKARGSQV